MVAVELPWHLRLQARARIISHRCRCTYVRLRMHDGCKVHSHHPTGGILNVHEPGTDMHEGRGIGSEQRACTAMTSMLVPSEHTTHSTSTVGSCRASSAQPMLPGANGTRLYSSNACITPGETETL